MKLVLTQDYKTMSRQAAEMLAEQIVQKPRSVLCLPTGGSVEGTYAELCAILHEKNISMAEIQAFNMDEYASLARDDVNSYYFFMKKHLYSKTDIHLSQTYSPEATAEDLQQACRDYTEKIRAVGGFDFTLLGIGTDGHIAFNMPRERLHLDTHVETLSQETIDANARFFHSVEDVPKQALSIGVGTIFQSKRIVLVANGSAKAPILKRLFQKRVLDPMLPASVLWLHPDVTVILDQQAAAEIEPSLYV
jgi:glucosamine-6-phosphate deaminase